MRIEAREIIDFWMNEVGPERWYKSSDALDAEIRTRFESHWQDAMAGKAQGWQCAPECTLALLILLDQMPRNMFRGTDRAFASDRTALKLAKKAIKAGHDLKTGLPERQFYYLPLEHSENLMDQEQGVRLIARNLESDENLLHARVHREVIREFGRFPYRNDALGRKTTEAEAAYLADGGYQMTMRKIAA
ncbi:DUF924 family protein [Algicella marina]|uniref:DUF924 family protein n=1 Tax=Algicella marina TaxID=2683284 RepID=A0A6P1SYG0_9RHOB|nr:DUF924 family protein [Algicella marina]QHQ34660.1 DUF924 family protein [Algicella marina]